MDPACHDVIVDEAGTSIVVHAGVPGWMVAVGVGLVVVLSFVAIERFGLGARDDRRIDLTARFPAFRWALRQRWFQPAFQLPVLLAFLAIIGAGLIGNSARNIAPVVVWTLWWAGLIFGVALAGNAWCFMCPWDALANLVTRLTPWRRTEPVTLGWTLPKWMTNLYPALVLFVVVTWLELGFGVTNDARGTAVMGSMMAFGAVGMALVYDKKAFCRSFCLVGRTSGMYAMFSPIEVRPGSDACSVCKTRACLTGNGRGFSCPTGLDLGKTNESTYCTLCTECFKSCNVPAVRLRPFARDLPRVKTWRTDEAMMALTLLALTGFHGLSMTPVWENLRPGTPDLVGWLRETLGVGQLSAFTVGMAGVMVIPFALYAIATGIAFLWVRGTGVGYRDLFLGYAYAVLPVALFYHLAHNAMHLFMEGQQVLPLLSDPLGWGTDFFGTAAMRPGPLLSMPSVWAMQVVLVVIGHVFGVVVAHRISRRMFADAGQALRSQVPMTALMVLLSVGGLLLMSLDMNMRGRM